jgi:hypothetical protein
MNLEQIFKHLAAGGAIKHPIFFGNEIVTLYDATVTVISPQTNYCCKPLDLLGAEIVLNEKDEQIKSLQEEIKLLKSKLGSSKTDKRIHSIHKHLTQAEVHEIEQIFIVKPHILTTDVAAGYQVSRETVNKIRNGTHAKTSNHYLDHITKEQ